MANELNRKVVLIRKKPEELKVEQLAKPTPDELTSAPKGGGPTEKQRQRRQEAHREVAGGAPGAAACAIRDRIELWDQFVARCCSTGRPNIVFTRMIREAVVIAEKTEASDTLKKPRTGAKGSTFSFSVRPQLSTVSATSA